MASIFRPVKQVIWRWLLLLSALVGSGFFYVGAALSAAAGWAMPADVVVVLGGDSGQRYTRGREMLLNGYSKRLLLIHPSDAVRRDAVDRLRGVSVQFDVMPHNSRQEAQVVRSWMQANALKSALVVSDPPHMLRLLYVWSSIFRGTDMKYDLIATDPPWWSAVRWWANPVSASFVHSEVLKLGYYLLHYRFGLF